MSEKTKIEWTDATWNPVEGCTMAKGSETGGCLNCYAARNALRRPASGLSVMRPSGPRWTGKVGLVEKRLLAPLSWREPKRVFVNSMSDLFHEALPDEAIDRVFAVMALCPQHTFQVLTKRPERMLEYLGTIDTDDESRRERMDEAVQEFSACHANMDAPERWPLPNVWLGVPCEDQKTADERIPVLLRTPAAKRFVSYEPALCPVDFSCMDNPNEPDDDYTQFFGGRLDGAFDALRGKLWILRPPDTARIDIGDAGAHIDWLIVGGESGPGARPFDIAWARQMIRKCKEAGVALFIKQLGAKPLTTSEKDGVPITRRGELGGRWIILRDRKGGDMSEWPEDLRVREFPA